MSASRIIASAEELARHDRWVGAHTHGSLWQSAAWRGYQEALGRTTRVYILEHGGSIMAAASVIMDTTVGGYSVWECPRGPLWNEGGAANELLRTIAADAKRERCMRLLLSPPVSLAQPIVRLGESGRHVHPQATLLVDLTAPEDQILAQMHPKGRYNIKVAEKQGVTVTQSTDIASFYRLLSTTGQRDGFTIHQESHYARFLQSLDTAFLLLATHEGRPIAGLLGVRWNATGTYYYGASAYEQRALMAPYALQWAAMRHCKACACTQYDLLGIDAPDAAPTTWRGITDFKRKFGGTLKAYPAERQLLLRPLVNLVIMLKRKILG